MTTDITELAQREKFEAWWEREYKHLESSKYTDAVPHIQYGFWTAYQAGGAELVEALEKAQQHIARKEQILLNQDESLSILRGELEKARAQSSKWLEAYHKAVSIGARYEERLAELEEAEQKLCAANVTLDARAELAERRLAEMESRTVKPPVHPTVASEKLDDETLQELIEFRRTTFEYHSKEGNKVQTIIHGVTLAALRELQERRKADSEPVAEVVSIYGDPEAFGEREIRPLVGIQQMPYGTKLYRHAQPAPVVQCPFPCGWDNLNKLAIQDAALVARGLVEGELTTEAHRQAAISNNDRLLKVISACRAAMLAAAPQSPGSEPATVPGKWIPVSEQKPENKPGSYEYLVFETLNNRVNHDYWNVPSEGDDAFTPFWNYYGEHVTHWMPLPAAPREVK